MPLGFLPGSRIHSMLLFWYFAILNWNNWLSYPVTCTMALILRYLSVQVLQNFPIVST